MGNTLINKSAFLFQLCHMTDKEYCVELIHCIYSTRNILNPKEKGGEGKEGERKENRRIWDKEIEKR